MKLRKFQGPMEVTFNYVEGDNSQHVICDTNVWYGLANQSFNKPEDVSLIATSLTLMELASSEHMANSINLYQSVLKSLHDNVKMTIPLNPLDFVLFNHDPNYPFDDTTTKKVLSDFSNVLSRDIPENTSFSEDEKNKLLTHCQENRKATVDFATFASEELIQVRKNINKGVGKKEHVKIDTEEINREMMKSVLTEHAKKVSYEIDFESFDWNKIELFMVVTENYFKKLEITKDMKIKPNDAVDWLNMLYVTPIDKYLTFEKSWRKLIESDDRSANYLFS